MSTDVALLARIHAVEPVHADTIGRRRTNFTVEALPFYRTFKLLTAGVSLPHRRVEFHYADDGRQLIHLTGAPEAIYRTNDADGMELSVGCVAAYTRCFLRHFIENPGTPRRVAETPDDLCWLPGTETDPLLRAAMNEASAYRRPLVVSVSPDATRSWLRWSRACAWSNSP